MLGQLHQIKTKDGLVYQGIFYTAKIKKAAAIWLGGLASRFPDRVIRTETLAQILNNAGISFGIFDHRGAGVINSLKVKKGKKIKYILSGTTYEKFENCILDVEAIIKFCKKLGYKKIFLLGHSTGANKLAYYIYKKAGKNVAGFGLLGPLSDVPGFKLSLGKKYRSTLKLAQQMIRQRKGDDLIPTLLRNNVLWTANRFWSIARDNGVENTFPAYNPKIKFYWTKKIKQPILIIIGSQDQHADIPVKKIFSRFKQEIPNQWFSGKIITGADHGFNKKEKELAISIAQWIKKNNTRSINSHL